MHVRQAAPRQLAQHVFEQGLRLVVVRIVGRRDRREPDADAIGADLGADRIERPQQQPRPVLDRAAVRVVAMVAARAQELVQQVAIGGMQLDPVETMVDRGPRGAPVVLHDARQLVQRQRAGLRGIGELPLALRIDQVRARLGADRRGRDRRALPRLQGGVRNAPHMPQLHHDRAAGRVHRVRHAPPAGQLFGRVQPRHVRVALALVGNGGGFGDDQAGAGALHVVGGRQGRRHGIGRTVARQRRHHDAVGEPQLAGVQRLEQRGHGLPLG
ncbi:Uncharacterised protein [Bordetella pertussis]|nr:Uncharacterised protein [Bordetella pertussis]